jgi:pilus assembly protein CpaE
MSKIVLATSNAGYEQRVRRAVFGGESNGTLRRWHDDIMLTNPSRAVKEMAAEGADVVGIGPNVDVRLALDFARAFEVDHPEIPVIVIAEPIKGIWQKALRAGVLDVLTTEATDEEIAAVFHRALETSKRRRSNLLDEIGESGPSGRVITLIAPKGGSGKTALATNMALGLSRGDEKVVLIDLDLQFGDVAGSLSAHPKHTIGDLVTIPGRLTATTLKVFLTPQNENLFLLCAPDSPAEGEEVDDVIIEQVVRLLSEEFPYVVIDTSAGLSEATLTAIELSTDLVLVCDLSVAAVRAMRKVIDALDRLGIDQPRRHFVLNRADSRVGIEVKDAAAVVGLPVAATIPSARAVPLSMNQGVALVESSPRSPVGKSFLAAARLFSEAPAKRSRFSSRSSK